MVVAVVSEVEDDRFATTLMPDIGVTPLPVRVMVAEIAEAVPLTGVAARDRAGQAISAVTATAEGVVADDDGDGVGVEEAPDELLEVPWELPPLHPDRISPTNTISAAETASQEDSE